ncbi:MAG TPA: hypothetical protein VK457_01415 [Chloroflexota bacterium]|nr:hypothetical protein [Chloroflexota bacterium]
MLRRSFRYIPLQTYFLVRAGRLGQLHSAYQRVSRPPDERTMLLVWALRSTLAYCKRLGVEDEARATISGRNTR